MNSFWQGFEKRAVYVEKKTYKTMPIEHLDPERKDQMWTSKIDGAFSLVQMAKGKLPRLFSHRISKRTGGPIEYTSKLPHITTKSPFDAVVRAETYAIDSKGRAVKPEVVAALLNSKQENSLALQKRLGIRTATALIDVDRFQGRDVLNAPFKEKHEILKVIAKNNPDFHLPDFAVTPREKKTLLQKIVGGKHKQTREGVVVHNLHTPGSHFIKSKIIDHHDVYVTGIFHEEGVKAGRKPMAGGFTYAWEQGGKSVGRVGTGFSHTMKTDMLNNPDKYVGMVAKVKALDVSKNKVLIKPSFDGWHVEKNL